MLLVPLPPWIVTEKMGLPEGIASGPAPDTSTEILPNSVVELLFRPA